MFSLSFFPENSSSADSALLYSVFLRGRPFFISRIKSRAARVAALSASLINSGDDVIGVPDCDCKPTTRGAAQSTALKNVAYLKLCCFSLLCISWLKSVCHLHCLRHRGNRSMSDRGVGQSASVCAVKCETAVDESIREKFSQQCSVRETLRSPTLPSSIPCKGRICLPR